MKVLILAGKKTHCLKRFRNAFLEKGFSKADFLAISKLNLVSRGGKTEILGNGIKFGNYDAVFLRVKLKLAPFIEPLLDELKEEHIYSHFRPGSYYLNSNEALQLAALNDRMIPIAKTIIAADPKRIMSDNEKYNYPLIFKSYKGTEKTQSILIETPRSLQSITKSIKMDLDAVVVREFEESDLLHCVVIGDRVFCIRRRWNGNEIEKLEKGIASHVSDNDRAIAIRAALACGCEIATVKICRGLVTDVIPDINFSVFSRKTGVNIFEVVAEHFKNRIHGIKIKKPKTIPSLFGRFKNFLEAFFYGGA